MLGRTKCVACASAMWDRVSVGVRGESAQEVSVGERLREKEEWS